jgi:hypothetical protein
VIDDVEHESALDHALVRQRPGAAIFNYENRSDADTNATSWMAATPGELRFASMK